MILILVPIVINTLILNLIGVSISIIITVTTNSSTGLSATITGGLSSHVRRHTL